MVSPLCLNAFGGVSQHRDLFCQGLNCFKALGTAHKILRCLFDMMSYHKFFVILRGGITGFTDSKRKDQWFSTRSILGVLYFFTPRLPKESHSGFHTASISQNKKGSCVKTGQDSSNPHPLLVQGLCGKH